MVPPRLSYVKAVVENTQERDVNKPNPYKSPQSSGEPQSVDKPQSSYRTAPEARTDMPPGIPYIVTNEAAERFSFYGMRGILTVFMTKHLLDHQGQEAFMSNDEAKSIFHLFVSGAYFFPILGALLADGLLGKYRTIIYLSWVYCLGHLALAMDETRLGLYLGLSLIAVGSGGIKPCVSAHVGDQFGASNQHLLEKVFGWFYFSINLGAFVSSLLTPWLLQQWGPGVAFGVPGVLMLLATLLFWMGRHKFVHIPAGGLGFVSEAFSGEGLLTTLKLCIIYAFIAVFWSLYDQTGSAWVLQAESMDRTFSLAWLTWLGTPSEVEVLASQIQAFNPLLILLFIPLFSYVIYPAIHRIFPLTPMRKISIGLFITVLAFAVSALIEQSIISGGKPHIFWQLIDYIVITAAEVMVSITALEFSYTQAPKTMKSFIMALYLLSVSAGNLFTSGVNYFIQNADGSSKLSGASYYWFFTGLMLVASILFIIVAYFYKEKRHLQDEQA